MASNINIFHVSTKHDVVSFLEQHATISVMSPAKCTGEHLHRVHFFLPVSPILLGNSPIYLLHEKKSQADTNSKK